MAAEMKRVVITGLGVVAPQALRIEDFVESLRNRESGIRKIELLEQANFRCQVGGVPQGISDRVSEYLLESDLLAMNEAMIYGAIASMDAWKDAGLPVPERSGDEVDWESGCILGSGLSGMDTIGKELVPKIDAGKVRRLGSGMVEQTMASAISAKLGGLLALGNQVTSNSSACNTGTEAIHDAYQRIRTGLAKRMVAGGAEGSSPYIWGGFDAMRVLDAHHNDQPHLASRPMSASAGGFVPGSGSGVLVLEELETARSRGVRIYAEVLGATVNCGGHRNGGSMTAPNSEAVVRCIRDAIFQSEITPTDIDLINGHLTGTMGDVLEVNNWATALEVAPENFPQIQSTKTYLGHCLGAAGGIETVALVLQMYQSFVHGSSNCEDLHAELLPYSSSIPIESVDRTVSIGAKSSFGFGDVNGCLILKRWE